MANLKTPTTAPADRPVPQVREALELEIEKWDTDERVTYPDHEVLESLDRILDALTARPSDAAVAWRKTLKQIRHYCDENLGPSRSSLLNKIAKLADDALALPPDEPARVAPSTGELAEWKQAASVEAGLRREFLARAERAEKALDEIIDRDTVISDGGKVHDHGPCAEIAILALASVAPSTVGGEALDARVVAEVIIDAAFNETNPPAKRPRAKGDRRELMVEILADCIRKRLSPTIASEKEPVQVHSGASATECDHRSTEGAVWHSIESAPRGVTLSVARKGGARDDGSVYYYQGTGHFGLTNGVFHKGYGELYGEPELWTPYPENPEHCAAHSNGQVIAPEKNAHGRSPETALPDGEVAWRKAVANEIRRVAGRDLSAAQCDNLAGAVIALYAFPHPESGDVRENLTMEECAQVLAVPDADEIEKLRSQLVNGQWQPIVSAPRDGAWLLVWETGINDKYHPAEIARFIRGRWENSSRHEVNAIAWKPAPEGPSSLTDELREKSK